MEMMKVINLYYFIETEENQTRGVTLWSRICFLDCVKLCAAIGCLTLLLQSNKK